MRAARHTPFRWGEHDCGLFVGDAMAAIGRPDPVAPFRQAYSSMLGAFRIIRRAGGMRAFGARFGREIDPRLAHRGDVVLLPNGRWEAFGLCLGRVCCAPRAEGLGFVPTSAATAAWRRAD